MRTLKATIHPETSTETVRKEMQQLIEKGVLKDLGINEREEE